MARQTEDTEIMADEKIIGLIAGGSRLPVLIAQGAKRAGCKVICAGLADNPEEELKTIADVYFTVPLARPGVWIRKLKKYGAVDAIMAGKVYKEKLFTPRRILKYLPDWRAVRIYYWRLKKQDKADETILQALADELESGGVILQDSTKYISEHLATKGLMTKTAPTAQMQEDIAYGWEMVKKLAETGIGQAIAVKEKTVIAVEAVEGTEEMLARCGKYCPKGGWLLAKAAKPNHDMRFDVPCVGPDTIKSISAAGGKALVVEAEKTIIIDKPQTIELADKLTIVVVGL